MGGRLLVLDDEGKITREVRVDGLIRIGKGPDLELTLADPHVSRIHAQVDIGPEGVTLRDLDSRNGTLLSGVPIKEAQLIHGAVISLGKSRIRFEEDDRDDDDATRVEPRRSRFGDAIGAAPSMQDVFALLAKLAPTEVSTTLIGETGTGKDVLARAIHQNSPRKAGPFIVFDCGAVAENLIESELFGHERGAFTGAVAERQGAFELANGGTLFVDEVGELPLNLQPRLLRVLEQREVQRVGGAGRHSVDVRVIAATNRDLASEVAEGRFRQDLFFRLSGAVVPVPPLRDRTSDIPALVQSMLTEMGNALQVAPVTLAALASYDWPGNVRELKNVISSAAAFADGPMLEPRHLMFFKPKRRHPTLEGLPLAGRTLEMIERAAIKQTLEQESGNKTRAARSLGIAPSTLYEKIKKYKL